MYKIGAIIQPREGETPLVQDHYRVVNVTTDTVHLERLFVKAPPYSVQWVNSVVYIPRPMFASFDLIEKETDDS